jgi:hypothetical protein
MVTVAASGSRGHWRPWLVLASYLVVLAVLIILMQNVERMYPSGFVGKYLQLGAYPLASGSWSLNNCGRESSARPTRHAVGHKGHTKQRGSISLPRVGQGSRRTTRFKQDAAVSRGFKTDSVEIKIMGIGSAAQAR